MADWCSYLNNRKWKQNRTHFCPLYLLSGIPPLS